MSARAVTEKIIQALADYLRRNPESIDPKHHLRDDLGLDSMAVIELLYKYVEHRLAPAKRPAARSRPAKSRKKN
jgi:acyl carrier protein